MCPCTRKKRNDEWRAGKDLPFGLSGLGAACGVARACKAPALLRTRALHPASRPGNAIPKNGVDRPLLHHERYTAPTDLAAEIGDYDAQLRDFQASEGLPEIDWSDLVLQRLRNADSLEGRHRLVEALRGAGFPLR